MHGTRIRTTGILSNVVTATAKTPSLHNTACSVITSLALAAAGGDEIQDSDTSSNLPFAMLSPRGRACFWMAMAMALHFGGYEFARSSSLALFTSPQTGFRQTKVAVPIAMAFVSPLSVLLLFAYTYVLEKRGPRVALRQSTLGSMAAIGLSAALVVSLPNSSILSKWLVGLAFVFQNSYAHLLYSQHWSFLGSVCSVEDGARWFASIAGLSSVASTCSGSMVGPLVKRIGLYGLLSCTIVTLTASLLCAERAYQLSHIHQFDPGQELLEQAKQKALRKEQHSQNLIQKAQSLFHRVPTLKALFCEVLSFQCMSTILNVCLVTTLKSTIGNDHERAAWTGRFYALINAVSALFQFVVLPLGMKNISPTWAWRLMPIVPLVACLWTALQTSHPSLLLLAVAFFVTKCCDYSIRGVVTEMIYVPLDFDSRFVGKEVNGVFGNRLGKSGMSVLLSVLTAGGGVGLPQLTQMAAVASLAWTTCAMWLSRLVADGAHATRPPVTQERDSTRDEAKED